MRATGITEVEVVEEDGKEVVVAVVAAKKWEWAILLLPLLWMATVEVESRVGEK